MFLFIFFKFLLASKTNSGSPEGSVSALFNVCAYFFVPTLYFMCGVAHFLDL